MAQGDIGIYASQISGHLWAPNGAMDALATVTVPSGGAASVTFAGIPQGYKHLQIRGTWLGDLPSLNLSLRFNSDSGSNYSWHQLDGYSGSMPNPRALSATSQTSIAAISWYSSTYPSSFVCDILDYASTSKNKTIKSLYGTSTNGGNEMAAFASGSWMNSTAPVNSITLATSIAQGSTFSLYGVK